MKSLLLGLALLGATCTLSCAESAQGPAIGAAEVAALADTSCPKPVGLDLSKATDREKRRALRGRFEVFGVRTDLRPPIGWAKNPIDSQRFQQNLLKLRFLEPLLAAYVQDGNEVALEHAIAVLLDFDEAQPRGGRTTAPDAWGDKVTGDRVPFAGFAIRSAACAGLLEDEEMKALTDLALQHGETLADQGRYEPNNHGLFVDIGLLRTAAYFPFLDEAGSWQELARARFIETLRNRLSKGVWLEHSTSYQFLAIRAVDDFIDATGATPALRRTLSAMRAAARWMVLPDGSTGQFGDSDLQAPPPWAREADDEQGLKAFFGAGLAAVRERSNGTSSYLAVTAAFHNVSHKHADELSFELYERGHRIVSDTGLFHKDPGEERKFVISPEAHSTLTVDGKPWPIDDNKADYGSALSAAGAGAGWYAILARNPLIVPQGVRHSRLFLYRPGRSLIVVDRVRSARRHRYTRYLQLGPALRRTGGAFGKFRAGEAVFDVSDSARGARLTSYRDRSDPLGGLTAPAFRRFIPRWTLEFKTTARDADYAMTINLDEIEREVTTRRIPGGFEVEVDQERDSEVIEVRRRGRRLTVDVEPRRG